MADRVLCKNWPYYSSWSMAGGYRLVWHYLNQLWNWSRIKNYYLFATCRVIAWNLCCLNVHQTHCESYKIKVIMILCEIHVLRWKFTPVGSCVSAEKHSCAVNDSLILAVCKGTPGCHRNWSPLSSSSSFASLWLSRLTHQ
jgi:hypothetical protein